VWPVWTQLIFCVALCLSFSIFFYLPLSHIYIMPFSISLMNQPTLHLLQIVSIFYTLTVLFFLSFKLSPSHTLPLIHYFPFSLSDTRSHLSLSSFLDFQIILIIFCFFFFSHSCRSFACSASTGSWPTISKLPDSWASPSSCASTLAIKHSQNRSLFVTRTCNSVGCATVAEHPAHYPIIKDLNPENF
jgi:hypothetical protein